MRTTTPPQDPQYSAADAAGPADLAGLQRWFQTAILHPHGEEGEGADQVAAVLTGSSRQAAHERLAVYQRGYRLRLLGSLHSCFPALHHLLGPEAFDVLAAEYLDALPPRGYTLDRYMQGFPAHLIQARPDARRPADERDPWVDLVVGLARFERAFAEVYDAPEPHPHRLLACRHPVHTYAAAVAHGQDPAPPPARPVLLTLRRRGHTVVVTETAPQASSHGAIQPRHTAQARTPA
jgi:hypothetical protein